MLNSDKDKKKVNMKVDWSINTLDAEAEKRKRDDGSEKDESDDTSQQAQKLAKDDEFYIRVDQVAKRNGDITYFTLEPTTITFLVGPFYEEKEDQEELVAKLNAGSSAEGSGEYDEFLEDYKELLDINAITVAYLSQSRTTYSIAKGRDLESYIVSLPVDRQLEEEHAMFVFVFGVDTDNGNSENGLINSMMVYVDSEVDKGDVVELVRETVGEKLKNSGIKVDAFLEPDFEEEEVLVLDEDQIQGISRPNTFANKELRKFTAKTRGVKLPPSPSFVVDMTSTRFVVDLTSGSPNNREL